MTYHVRVNQKVELLRQYFAPLVVAIRGKRNVGSWGRRDDATFIVDTTCGAILSTSVKL
jgi:hypothetical protein